MMADVSASLSTTSIEPGLRRSIARLFLFLAYVFQDVANLLSPHALRGSP